MIEKEVFKRREQEQGWEHGEEKEEEVDAGYIGTDEEALPN